MLSLYVRYRRRRRCGGALFNRTRRRCSARRTRSSGSCLRPCVILTGSFTLNISAINASISGRGHVSHRVDAAVRAGAGDRRAGARHLSCSVVAQGLPLAARRLQRRRAGAVAVGRRPRLLPDHRRRAAVRRMTRGSAPLIPALFFLATIYFALNSGLIAIAVGLESRRSPFKIWYEHFLWLSIGYFAAASVGLGLIVILRQVGLGGGRDDAAAVVAIFHHTLRASFGRLEDARRHVTQIDRLYLSTVETLAMAIDAKDDVTHSHVRRVQAYAAALARELEGQRRADPQGDRGGGAAARHRQAGDTRADPQQAGRADAGRVRGDEAPCRDRREYPLAGRFSISRRADRALPSRELGRLGVSRGRGRAPTSRSGRGSCRWSTALTR